MGMDTYICVCHGWDTNTMKAKPERENEWRSQKTEKLIDIQIGGKKQLLLPPPPPDKVNQKNGAFSNIICEIWFQIYVYAFIGKNKTARFWCCWLLKRWLLLFLCFVLLILVFFPVVSLSLSLTLPQIISYIQRFSSSYSHPFYLVSLVPSDAICCMPLIRARKKNIIAWHATYTQREWMREWA